MQADDQTLLRRATAILVSNNPLGEGHLPYADDLEGGKLGLYVTGSRRWGELLQLAARLTVGDIAENPTLEKWHARTIELDVSRPRSNASVDGEIVPLETPIRFRIVPRGLKVLRPGPGPGSPDCFAARELPKPGRVCLAQSEAEQSGMTEEVTKTEARQGDRRRMNRTVVLVGTPLAFILLGLLVLYWA
jgi:hypothetical protein